MSEDRKLPAPDFCNRDGAGKPNPIPGKGALGNQYSGRMFYTGSQSDKEKWVTLAQEMLIALEYDVGEKGADGKFGNDTEKAVKKFQEVHEDWGGEKLNVDGLIGPETADALNRKMVEKRWYDFHQTEKSLTITFSLLTVRSDALKKIPFAVGETEKGKVVIVGEIPEQTHAASEFFMLYPALGLPDTVTDGAVTALLLFKKDSWVLGKGKTEEEWKGVRHAIAEKLGYSAWDKKDSESDVIPVKLDQINELAWLGVLYSGINAGNNGRITDTNGDKKRELVLAQHAMDHLKNGAGLETSKVLRIRVSLEDLNEGLFTLKNKSDETGFVKKALTDVQVPGSTPRNLNAELTTLISCAPVRQYHPFFISNNESLDIGHITDVHVSTRHELYERILNNRIPQWNNFNRSFEEVMQGASGKADLILLTGDLIDYNRGHKIDLSRNDGNTYENERNYLRDYYFNRNWILFYELLVRNYKKPVFTVLGNHEYLLNPYRTNMLIRIILGMIPIIGILPLQNHWESFAPDMNLTRQEHIRAIHEPEESHTINLPTGLRLEDLMENHDEARLLGLIRQNVPELIDDPANGCWYTNWESATWYFLLINPFKDYWITYRKISILMLDWNAHQHVGSLLLLPRPTGSISYNQFDLMNSWLTQRVSTFMLCSHAPVCDPWTDLGNYYLEKSVLKRKLDETDDYMIRGVDPKTDRLNLGTVEEGSRRHLLDTYIFSSPPRIQVVLSGHSHTNRIFQLVTRDRKKYLVLKREEKPDTWDLTSPFLIVTNSGGNLGRTNEVAEWKDIILPGYRVLKFDNSGKLKPENQVFFSKRIQIRDSVQEEDNADRIRRFPPPSGSPDFNNSVQLDSGANAIIDRVFDTSKIPDLDRQRKIVVKKIEQQGIFSIESNRGLVVVEENHGTLNINDNNHLINADYNYGMIRVNQNDDFLLVHVNHGTIEVANNGSGSPGIDLIKLFDNHGTLTINPPHGNESVIMVQRNHENGTITVNYNNDTINIAENRGILNINSNEGGAVDSTINILDNKGGTINIRNNLGDVNICEEDQGTVNRLENSGEINMRSRQWLKDNYEFE